VGGIPIFAAVLGLLFILLLIAFIGLWRRTGGGRMMGTFGRPAAPPGPGEAPPRQPSGSPMSVTCTHCGKPIDLTTSRRPVEVMCPSCGETQLVS
ncbi:MAG: hypothetical protein L3J78_04985, partial [Thermoplasmata archaeon]|nr:hypothetical protein [Thermoplasmata archaeon]